ncbi:alpha/beta fold hydrolase [Streptomyces sp. NPDC059698]|uniref:alpha/beta fold hydrolase n=1 Tax=unclassified Streptomyces TaxID=2593676 RepID=UPI0009397B3E|nr:alpha/beta hydrolase [Streptomyces sp. CB02366]OKJ40606.1 hydrolase [Streptomyces sp. CB02366]WSS57560.1 alpha/beta hydrolase [Streptomyces sp. NBC_01178]
MSRPPTFTPPPCARSRVLRTERGDFAVLEAVPRTPARATALLLPGYTGSKEDFVALLEPLCAAGYRVLAVDGRGQYASRGTGRQESYAQVELARDVLAQAAASEAGPGELHLLGHSLGGQIARAAVLLDATPFRSLTLMSSGPAEVVAAQRDKVKMLSDALAVLSMDEVWEAMRALDPPQDADTGDGADLRRRWLAHDPAQLIATGAQLASEPDRVDELAAVGLPVHVLSGERDDVWPVELFDAMARRLGARRTTIAGAEHSPNTARPQETARALAAFWDGLGPSA